MKNCNKIYDNIFFFDQLNKAEQDEVRAHIGNCDDCRTHFEKVEKIVSGLKQVNGSNHINQALLVRYVSHLNAPNETDFDGEKLTTDSRRQVESHLKECKNCSEKVSLLQKEYAALHSFIEDGEIPDIRFGRLPVIDKIRIYSKNIAGKIRQKAGDLLPTGTPAWAPPALAAAALLMIVLLMPGIFEKSTPSSESIAKLDPVEARYMMRNGIKPQLEQGFILFNEGQFAEAAHRLETFIGSNPGYDNIGYVRYICGLAYLMHGTSDPESSMDTAIDRGIGQLNACLSEDIGLRLKEDVLWYLGKAYLIKNQAGKAKDYFKQVLSLNGRNAEKAKSILHEIENP